MFIDLSALSATNHIPTNEFEIKVLDFIKYWSSPSKTLPVQTSGSTGKPKIFEIEKSKMLNSAQMTCDFLQLKEGDSALLCLPIEYISGKMMLVRSILRKLKLYIVAPSSNPLQTINRHIDFCAMTPLQVENSLEKLHLIKNLIIGGASVSESLIKKIRQSVSPKENCQIYETYGMSETLSHIALKEIFPKQEEWFRVFDGVDISLDERGCLRILAPELNPDILQTNDLVTINNDNQFRFLGRIDNVINSSGAKIFPEELEKIVKQYIPNEVVFIGVDDEKLGQKLVLIIENPEKETRKNASEIEELKLKIKDIKFQKSYHKPKDIIFVEKIPRTGNGKVNRLLLIENLKKITKSLQ